MTRSVISQNIHGMPNTKTDSFNTGVLAFQWRLKTGKKRKLNMVFRLPWSTTEGVSSNPSILADDEACFNFIYSRTHVRTSGNLEKKKISVYLIGEKRLELNQLISSLFYHNCYRKGWHINNKSCLILLNTSPWFMKNQDNDISVPIKMKVPSQGGEGGEGGHGWPLTFQVAPSIRRSCVLFENCTLPCAPKSCS